jgi:pimeloyl-ACP methyl ester carboxylesterase
MFWMPIRKTICILSFNSYDLVKSHHGTSCRLVRSRLECQRGKLHPTAMKRPNISLPGYPTLILQHFFGSSSREWEKVIPELESHFRCIAIDTAGFGSAAGLEGGTVEELAQLLLGLIRSLAPEPCLVVGHSMTGKVSMVAASRRPENMMGLVLVAPSPLNPEPIEEPARIVMAAAQQNEATAREFFIQGATRPLSKEDIAIGVEDVMRANAVAWRRWPQSGTREDWSLAIRSIDLPSLLVVGEEDPAIPLAFQREHTLPHLANGTLKVIPDTGHLVPYEAPKELAALILSFASDLLQ